MDPTRSWPRSTRPGPARTPRMPCWWRCRTWNGRTAAGLPPTGPERQAGLAEPVRQADDLLGRLLERVDLDRDRVIVVSPAAPGGFGRLTTFAMAGRGIEPGQARSATTRRDGFVTLPDVGVTVLDSVGLAAPSTMNATAITSAGGRRFTVEEAIRMAEADELARFRDRTVGPVSVVYIVLQVLTYAAGGARPHPGPATPAGRGRVQRRSPCWPLRWSRSSRGCSGTTGWPWCPTCWSCSWRRPCWPRPAHPCGGSIPSSPPSRSSPPTGSCRWWTSPSAGACS